MKKQSPEKTTTATSRSTGNWAEKVALDYLEKQGLELVARNYHARGGEIDLVMQDKDTTAFIEVRYRASEKFISAVESIDAGKCQRIIKTSQHFLLSSGKPLNNNCRFDVVTITGSRNEPRIGWIKNAFEA